MRVVPAKLALRHALSSTRSCARLSTSWLNLASVRRARKRYSFTRSRTYRFSLTGAWRPRFCVALRPPALISIPIFYLRGGRTRRGVSSGPCRDSTEGRTRPRSDRLLHVRQPLRYAAFAGAPTRPPVRSLTPMATPPRPAEPRLALGVEGSPSTRGCQILAEPQASSRRGHTLTLTGTFSAAPTASEAATARGWRC